MTTILRLLLGFICGVAATGPMSAIMVAIHRRLPERERYPLPPREITTKALDRVVGASAVDPSTRSALTWLAHFGYGGAAGAIYAQVHPSDSRQVVPGGVLFGLLVWSISYLGLLPGLRVLRPATEQPARRNALMIVAHLAWGIALAGLYEIFLSDVAEEKAAFDTSSQPHRDGA
jgi:uncharacterized membrane protein YagU involved in acid resistance